MFRRFIPVRMDYESHLKEAERFQNKNNRISRIFTVLFKPNNRLYHLNEHVGYWMDSNKVNDTSQMNASKFPVPIHTNLLLHVYQSFRDFPLNSLIKLSIGVLLLIFILRRGK